MYIYLCVCVYRNWLRKTHGTDFWPQHTQTHMNRCTHTQNTYAQRHHPQNRIKTKFIKVWKLMLQSVGLRNASFPEWLKWFCFSHSSCWGNVPPVWSSVERLWIHWGRQDACVPVSMKNPSKASQACAADSSGSAPGAPLQTHLNAPVAFN